MKILSEPIGSIPRSPELIAAIISPNTNRADLQKLYDNAIKETIKALEDTGSPVISDGEQTKSSFATYPLEGLTNLSPEGMRIDFKDGHHRQLPLLNSGPFKYGKYAVEYLKAAQQQTQLPVKQAIISASALSLIYPQDGIEGYTQAEFMDDLLNECEKDIRLCLEKGAYKVQMDFTEGRLSLKLDPSGGVLKHFIAVNNQVFDRFSQQDQKKLGVHVCPGGDHNSTHSADIDYADFLPSLFDLNVGSFYLQLASEPDRVKVLKIIKQYLKPNQTVFVGVINVLNPVVETSEQVKDRIIEAAEYIPLSQLGTTDDCGFSPFCDDVSTTRETAFAKIKARIEGTKLAEAQLLS
ncbi:MULTISPECIES: cobalamin-independent methionine synthase II family protein [unclassified Mucilaginibacter]|uniref:cobalamin-independent methionine synthase II family protein n=1 Tax=unclassified Mucilaginibacter TaxID=2617802 RepID=UPI002AC89594|nr:MULTISPECIES: cobalamin-independent methionine synthase II family protein [unclassified Mucilaginibacter]MEB0261847.1 cobalamin-independent methionine synthase II family protein [Mucilaginibacter sp. 10I4]MEB0278932.1 cobalamin-independent methionine synthase II family protein [Mucilaginibacter sp. 10B2]MEB0302509.1 cobalamin-independent methionine synthase II family protein [Mucilaginibacter sp. 5C4]WPX22113.1 cobalamin-independent methionine synthase II family protein [Mucilaginibacter sp.